MKDWTPRLIIIGLLVLVLGVPFVLGELQKVGVPEPDPTADELIIVSPHNAQIRHEMEVGFNAWRQANGKGPVNFSWRSSGGTSDLRRNVIDAYAAADASGTQPDVGDLFFGGGTYDLDKLRQANVTQPIDLSEMAITDIFPTDNIGGEPLYHESRNWMGVVLSSFGIVYNKDVLGRIGYNVDENDPGNELPRTWTDLTDTRLYGWIALADPAHSGSIAATYNTILQRLGWDEGWRTLREIFANSRYFTSSAGKVPVDVSAGEAAAGMCIDFYGRYQAGAIIDDRVGYVDPPGMTAITADPISVLRGSRHEQLAQEFVRWTLTLESQMLWQYQKGTENGPRDFELRRLPIRRDFYTATDPSKWTDKGIAPYDEAKPFAPHTPNYFGAVAVVSHTIAIDVHLDLQRAWAAVIRSQGTANHERMLAQFERMPADLTLWRDPYIRENWEQILASPDEPMYERVVERLKAFPVLVAKSVVDDDDRRKAARQLRIDTFRKMWSDALDDPKHERHAEVTAIMANLKSSVGAPVGWEADQALRDRLRWTQFFRSNYRAVVDMEND